MLGIELLVDAPPQALSPSPHDVPMSDASPFELGPPCPSVTWFLQPLVSNTVTSQGQDPMYLLGDAFQP